MVLGSLAQAQCNPKIEAFTKQSGYTFKSDPKCRFWVTFEALSIPRDGMQGSVLIGEQEDVIVLGAVVKLKANLNLSSATLAKLLRLNHELDFVKVGIDNDGDLFLRAELHKASLDVAALKDAFERVQEGSQKVYDATQ
jgi:hypothetical protein